MLCNTDCEHKSPVMHETDSNRFSLVWDIGRKLLSLSLTYVLHDQEGEEYVQD